MTARLRSEWYLFLLAVQFLTRVPVPRDVPFSDELQTMSARYYPLVGLLVGGIGAFVLLSSATILSLPVAVLLSVAATMLITGALHEDGLADSADGLWGGKTRDRALEIMRDSRIGSYGVVALGVVLALKAALLMDFTPWQGAVALVVAHVVSRMAAVQIIAKDDYAREVGSKFAAPKVNKDSYLIALAVSLIALAFAVFSLGLLPAMSGLAVSILLAGAFRMVMLRKLQGYTGDCLGGIQQVFELGFYLGIALWL